ncbi:Kinesin-like protein KIF27 [Termitomyces sp. J132]|nr:Kinesin-like protein KIF27 [Termitomyces sp. J132]
MPPQSSSSAMTTSVKVALRIRPPTNQDSTSIPARFQRSVIHATSSNTVSIEAASISGSGSGTLSTPSTPSSGSVAKKQQFSFDQVHPPNTAQYDLFVSTAKPLVSRFIEGFNCTILAYGQTSSGKTFTMTGIDLDADPADPNNGMGIVPRAVSTIFSSAKQLKEERGSTWTYSVKGSFIEIYNEDLIDLLSLDDMAGGRRDVQIREDKDGHIIWGGLREVNVRNVAEVMSLLRKGTSIRRTNETDMNAQSSRSHAIFSLTLTQKKYTGSTPPRGLRPSSALGHVGERLSHAGGDDEYGEWVTIVSKFHFVDLAGSERLKRTAAAGERIKEGISINSGLLALGNVISALGDPSRSKSHTASHIPYRDSKLTRLLQDSLGGNAHTLMIACVSPAEWNANETLNTLKYANRARNIKNRAVLNEKEDGWDDVEWLQGTVTRLRKELKTIKEGGVVVIDSSSSGVVDSSASKKVLAQMTELQNNYEEMRSTFVERTEELTRLRRELGEKQRISTAGAVGATARYEEIVGPVIEEYEKTIATMEAELSLNKAALRHTNELFEEKEEELTVLTERHAATELYVEELRNRVVKLTERETSTEAYVRDLEDKIKSYDETSITSSESLTDLKREIARFKEAETSSAQYIADLEARLGRSDESVLSLQRIVERLENECDRRQDEVKSLNSRLEALREDGNNWRSDLEERERKVKELETRMAEWEAKKKEAYDVRTRLGGVVDEVASAKKSLEINVANTPQTSEGVTSNPPAEQLAEVLTQPSIPGSALEKQLLALQQTHTATLADLSVITAKYRDALREISDLAAQIQEAKLNNPESAQSESPEKLVESPPVRRRMPSGRVKDAEPQYNSAGRRLFFRQAASTESLHARSLSQSQSLSQELSSVHSRKASFSSHGTSSSHSPSNSQSTLNYLSGVQNLSTSLPSSSSFNGSERSVHSLEHEIMRLQEVLKEREAEITLLEESLKERPLLQPSGLNGTAAATLSPKTLNQFDHIRKTMENGSYAHTDTGSEVNSVSVLSEADESLERLNELMLSMAQKESHHREVVDSLNNQLSQVQRQLDDLTTLSRDQALNMSTEIEGLRKKHDQHLEKLEEAESRASALSEALKKAEADYENEIDELRRRHQAILDAKLTDFDDTLARTKQDHSTSLSRLRDELKVASAVLEQSRRNHEQELGKLKANYSEELRLRLQEAHNTIDLMRDEHSKAMNRLLADHTEQLKQKDAETDAVLQRTEEEYYNALTKLREAHADTLVERAAESNANLERLREEHAAALQMREIARQGSLSESESSQARALKELQDAHAEAIVRKEVFFAEESQALKADHARTLAMKTDDFALHMDRLRLEYETTLAKLKEEHRMEVNSLHSAVAEAKADLVTASLKGSKDKDQAIFTFKEQQTLVLQGLQHSHDDQLTALKATHEATLQKARDEFEEERLRVTQSQADKIAKLEAQHQKDLDDVKITIGVLKDEHRLAIETLREQNERVLGEETNRLSTNLSSLKEDLQVAKTQAEQLAEEKKRLEDNVASLQSEHQETLQAAKSQIQLLEEKDRISASLVRDLESLRAEHDLVLQELDSHKVAADEFTLVREQARHQHEQEMEKKGILLRNIENQLSGVVGERNDLKAEVARLQEKLNKTRGEQSKLIQEASQRESFVGQSEQYRSALTELQENLQKVQEEKDAIQMERSRAENLVRELQAQLARSASPPHSRPAPERNLSYTRATGLPAMKLPPPTPPPSIPPPPAPTPRVPASASVDASLSISSNSSTTVASTSSRESQLESPLTSVPTTSPPPTDPKIFVQIEQQAKQINEQVTMINTLNKQLTHCESDLQAHMDLVSTLETSLSESEKNLRKARMHATEIARERDTLNAKLETVRNELAEAKREVVTVRRSIVEEKQSLEQKLDEERKAKERARSQLDSRMDEIQRRKSKFACL